MKSMSIMNYIILFSILIVLGILYRRFENKRIREENKDSKEAIQKYLLDDITLGKSKKPILWIHVPYEYNSRKWLSFGSRSSFELNQPYLYLTVRSIIAKCDNSFTICIVDDSSFDKLIPGWAIQMNKISAPISDNIRKLGMMKLLYRYGGITCPISFLCMKDLLPLYNKGIINNKMFVCENNNRNITSTSYDFYPDINFCGAQKENHMVEQLIDFQQRTISKDFTAASVFLGEFNRWVEKRVRERQINLISGVDVGIKSLDDKPIKLEDLLSNNYLDIYPQTYGIWIPSDEILRRTSFEWFSRLSEKQVLESDTILGNYILVNMGPKNSNVLEPMSSEEIKKEFVGFWRTPLQDVYGLKPNDLGDNMIKVEYPRE
jgi:hypothetical protein